MLNPLQITMNMNNEKITAQNIANGPQTSSGQTL